MTPRYTQSSRLPTPTCGLSRLYQCDDEPGKYETRGPHLAPLGLDADTPLVFTVRDRPTK